MTEIGLMMTGILTIRQVFGANVPQQQIVQIENDIKQLKESDLEITAQVTPPEFMQIDGISQAFPSAIALEKEHILQKISKNNQFLASSKLDQSKKHSQPVGKVRTKATVSFQKFSSEPMPTLYFGSSGAAVRVLQRLLVSNGYAVRVDGIYGALTETAVKAFQNQQNLGTDGVVGQRTWRALTI
ncbi:MAG: peptidoglycan-binding domain-containing protein [Nostoc sp.]|uniref:peptidoglycan-binding domain-containing protein n=1 Tax=Nostoc sp. TaxID=1180 RepID=UPI002FF9B072